MKGTVGKGKAPKNKKCENRTDLFFPKKKVFICIKKKIQECRGFIYSWRFVADAWAYHVIRPQIEGGNTKKKWDHLS